MENYKCEVSVGMPVWGVEKFIKRCLLSILDQDFEDMEVLVIDDCGPDKSIEIAESIASTHPKGNKIRIIRQPQNMGCWAARNRVLDEAQGKYILLVDSDDYMEDGAIPKLYKRAEETNADVTYGSIAIVDEEGAPIPDYPLTGIHHTNTVLNGKDKLASFANDNIHNQNLSNFIWNIMLRTSFIRKNGLRFRKTRFWDDVLFNADMQPLVESAAFISDITYDYVIRPNSLSNYQDRDVIKTEEIRQHISNHLYLKEQSTTLKGKPYYEKRVTKTELDMFYTLTGVIRNRPNLSEPIKDKEIRDAIKHPLSLKEIIHFSQYRTTNIFIWFLGVLPASISVLLLTLIGKAKKII